MTLFRNLGTTNPQNSGSRFLLTFSSIGKSLIRRVLKKQLHITKSHISVFVQFFVSFFFIILQPLSNLNQTDSRKMKWTLPQFTIKQMVSNISWFGKSLVNLKTHEQ
jgi:hypothetical protein